MKLAVIIKSEVKPTWHEVMLQISCRMYLQAQRLVEH